MPLVMKYFVLKPRAKSKYDPYATASQKALLTYADAISDEDPDLAKELRKWSLYETEQQELFRVNRGY